MSSTSTRISLPSEGAHSNDKTATATCFCGSVQIQFPTNLPREDYSAFVCHCTDCHKISSSMYCSNFIVADDKLTHVRGQELLSQYSTSKSVGTGNTMTNYFCKNCGTLLYRKGTGFPGKTIPRIGTVDDFELHSTLLKPMIEQYIDDRSTWEGVAKEAEQVKGFYWAKE